jgi:4-diphosphocytidyl-2-C-methyl-D-erythritol kinase
MEFFAPAKINLSLAVKGSRDDGFHEIETFISPVSIFDRLTIELREEGGLDFSCDEPALPMGHDNLVVRAANLFCADIGLEPHLRIVLQKTIPHGAGLGGGSSDAATTLRALDILFETRLPSRRSFPWRRSLAQMFRFLSVNQRPSAAAAANKSRRLRFRTNSRLLLIKPPFAVLTAWAYQRWGRRWKSWGALQKTRVRLGSTSERPGATCV